MAFNIGEAIISIKADASGIIKDIDKAGKEGGSVASGSFLGTFAANVSKGISGSIISGALIASLKIEQIFSNLWNRQANKFLKLFSAGKFTNINLLAKGMSKIGKFDAIGKSVSNGILNFGEALAKGIAFVSKYALAILAVIGVIGKLVQIFAKLESVIYQSKYAFGEVSEEANKFVNTLSSKLGSGLQETLTVATSLQTSLNAIFGDRGDALKGVEALTERIFDMSVALGITTEQATKFTEDIVRGEKKAMKQLGVYWTEAEEQIEMANVAAKMGLSITNQRVQAQARMNLLLKESVQYEKAFVKNQNTVGGSFKYFTTQLGEALTLIGGIIAKAVGLPAIFQLAGDVLKVLNWTLKQIYWLVSKIFDITLMLINAIPALFGYDTAITRIKAAWDDLKGTSATDPLTKGLEEVKEITASIAGDLDSIMQSTQRSFGKFLFESPKLSGINFNDNGAQNQSNTAKSIKELVGYTKTMVNQNRSVFA